jgi:hypothetical protein
MIGGVGGGGFHVHGWNCFIYKFFLLLIGDQLSAGLLCFVKAIRKRRNGIIIEGGWCAQGRTSCSLWFYLGLSFTLAEPLTNFPFFSFLYARRKEGGAPIGFQWLQMKIFVSTWSRL